jgi:hypothetical protein
MGEFQSNDSDLWMLIEKFHFHFYRDEEIKLEMKFAVIINSS